jgi:lipopolysaccharide/colanic/teichoic acid biosynthesis glycosyltransferase
MLFDFVQVADEDQKVKVFAELSESIPLHIRETDMCGWLKHEDLLGIVFTDIPRVDAVQVKETVELKVRDFLREKLDASMFGKLRLSTILFPDERKGDEQDEGFSTIFYPDIVQRGAVARLANGLKRVMDVIGAIVALLIFSPLFVTIPIAIKLTSPGPVFFRQKRLGLHGRAFSFLKFRSMKVNNDDSIHREFIKGFIANKNSDEHEKSGDQVIFKIQNDPRLTPIGNFLRKSSFDELPQFFNVLMGDMSLVGPRPPIPYEVDNYDVWHRFRILAKKPGITGLWQVKGRSLTTFDDMVRLDLLYVRTWSLWLDIKLLLATPGAVVRGKGAY